MPDLVTLSCPTCGAKLNVTDQVHLLLCRNCGNEHMVVRDSGTLHLAPLAQDVRQIRVGVDKTAAELAVARLEKEIEQLETEKQNVREEASTQLDDSGVEKTLTGLGLLVLSIAWCSANGGNRYVTTILFVVGAGFLITAYATYRSRERKVVAWRKSELQRIDTQIAGRMPQMTRHRHIAES